MIIEFWESIETALLKS